MTLPGWDTLAFILHPKVTRSADEARSRRAEKAGETHPPSCPFPVKSGREDLNLRPHGPEPCALAKLSYAPWLFRIVVPVQVLSTPRKAATRTEFRSNRAPSAMFQTTSAPDQP